VKKENLVGIVLFIIFLVVFGLLYKKHEKKKYKEKGMITIGTVTKVVDDYKKRPYVYYTFNIGAKIYSGKTAYPEFKANIESSLKNKTFPVIYINDSPEESQILISRAEFKERGMIFPDSLKWTIQLETPF
jgi:hypothetical protein